MLELDDSVLLGGRKNIYSARIRLPRIVSIPIEMPTIDGQSVPELGRLGAAATEVDVGVGALVDPGQLQSV